MAIQLTSSAFRDGQSIPTRHTCDGEDVSPPLAWSGIPAGTRSLALVCDDPDARAGTWVHWVVYGLPTSATELTEGLPKTPELANGARQGTNDFRRVGYGGPCPPPGKPHRYSFRLYAADIDLALPPGQPKDALMRALDGHILAQGQLLGTYGR